MDKHNDLKCKKHYLYALMQRKKIIKALGKTIYPKPGVWNSYTPPTLVFNVIEVRTEISSNKYIEEIYIEEKPLT